MLLVVRQDNLSQTPKKNLCKKMCVLWKIENYRKKQEKQLFENNSPTKLKMLVLELFPLNYYYKNNDYVNV